MGIHQKVEAGESRSALYLVLSLYLGYLSSPKWQWILISLGLDFSNLQQNPPRRC
jgi:hypothetical protein